MSFYSEEELAAIGFARLGRNVQISRKASFYGASRIEIGDYSRIDDFCVLSAGAGGISIGRNVHIAVFCSLIGAEKIELGDFSGLSSRVSIYSSNDDYSGLWMTNPTVPAEYTNVSSKPVRLERHVIVGSGSIVLPGVVIGEGTAIGSLSVVKRSCEPFSVYTGSPAKRMMARKAKFLELEERLRAAETQ